MKNIPALRAIGLHIKKQNTRARSALVIKEMRGLLTGFMLNQAINLESLQKNIKTNLRYIKTQITMQFTKDAVKMTQTKFGMFMIK